MAHGAHRALPRTGAPGGPAAGVKRARAPAAGAKHPDGPGAATTAPSPRGELPFRSAPLIPPVLILA